ncbi:BlaR1 peptidase M56 [Kordia sp. SMS9]|uniref:M56 family metallopeptidase n=1 Tax=Kordia sp. SMS9 TaxID=2282170 RepID=UPI000E0D59DC|nr:M56 family metallopeptidase [Kordia sp. SMS9]AXG69672.1 BlaR1 peptidase M56 [Kordia sp. SMS9]
MIAYIIKSGLCLVLVFIVYKILLERERMYVFNRFYLLFGLLFAFVVPFITIETTVEIPFTESATAIDFENMDAAALDTASENIQATTGISTWIFVIFGVYAIGYLLFFFRFIQNIYRIFHKIITSVKVRYKLASLVLLKEDVLPHTFLHYIFLKKEAYDTKSIADELYTHELAHVKQKHTLDIILIELIQVVFWFNPVLMYYKKAIQLNHEFLADEAVLQSNIQVPTYQQLLLANAHGNHNLHLASNLNFSVTKKRLQMMTKHTTHGRAWLMASLTIPILTAALFLFSTKVIAQKTTVKNVATTAKKMTNEQDSKSDYYKNATFVFEDAKGTKTTKNYAELTLEEKARLIPPPSKPVANTPTSQQLNAWKDHTKFAVWLDGKVIDNGQISNHKIVHYTQSFVYRNARSKRFPQTHQTQLYTAEGFKAMKSNYGAPLSKNAVLHFKEDKNIVRAGKKVGTTQKPSARHELAKTNQMPVHFVNEKNGPNEVELPLQNSPQKQQQKDIKILINKNKKFLVNDNYVVPTLPKLDKILKSELAKIKHKKFRTASIVYDPTVSKAFVLKTIALLKDHNIYDITTRNSTTTEEIRLPPPPPVPPAPPAPPAPKKTQIKEVKVPKAPKPSTPDTNAVSFMHKIIKGQKVETKMMKGKKYYSVVKNGQTYIFDEESRLVDENGKPIPPPPPPPTKKKAEIKEIKVPKQQKPKQVVKVENIPKKVVAKFPEKSPKKEQ